MQENGWSDDHEFQILDVESLKEKSVEEEDDLNIEVKAGKEPSASEALAGIETALKWMGGVVSPSATIYNVSSLLSECATKLPTNGTEDFSATLGYAHAILR